MTTAAPFLCFIFYLLLNHVEQAYFYAENELWATLTYAWSFQSLHVLLKEYDQFWSIFLCFIEWKGVINWKYTFHFSVLNSCSHYKQYMQAVCLPALKTLWWPVWWQWGGGQGGITPWNFSFPAKYKIEVDLLKNFKSTTRWGLTGTSFQYLWCLEF